jgi:hypothetical protein
MYTGIGSSDEEQRDAEAIAPVDEVRDFLRALGVDDAAEPRPFPFPSLDEPPLICNDADRHAGDRAVAADHLAGEVLLELVDGAAVEDGREDLVHVVGHAMVGREELVEGVRVGIVNC